MHLVFSASIISKMYKHVEVYKTIMCCVSIETANWEAAGRRETQAQHRVAALHEMTYFGTLVMFATARITEMSFHFNKSLHVELRQLLSLRPWTALHQYYFCKFRSSLAWSTFWEYLPGFSSIWHSFISIHSLVGFFCMNIYDVVWGAMFQDVFPRIWTVASVWWNLASI